MESGSLFSGEIRDQSFLIWLAALALPLIGLVVLLAAPSADATVEHHPSHFWLVLAAAVTSAGLALSTSGIALHRADARLFLRSSHRRSRNIRLCDRTHAGKIKAAQERARA